MSSKMQLILKRLIDILLSFIGLVLLTVPFAITALAIKLDSKGPIFFRQERVGLNGSAFRAWKGVKRRTQDAMLQRATKICSVGAYLRGYRRLLPNVGCG